MASGNRTRDTTASFEATVHGRVQGVGYRSFIFQRARALRLAGHVANLPDGAVQIVAAGERDSLNRLLEAMRKGPLLARVKDINVVWGLSVLPRGDFQLRI